jgi:hypothetical protein
VEDVEVFWSARKGSNIKSKLRISYRKTQRLIRLTGQEFDADKGSCVPYVLPSCGLTAPQMSSNMSVRQIRKFREDLNFDAGMDYSFQDGVLHSPSASNIIVAHLNLYNCVAKRIWDLKDHLDFANEVFLQSATDSTQTYRGCKQTTTAVKVVRLDGVGNNNPLAIV